MAVGPDVESAVSLGVSPCFFLYRLTPLVPVVLQPCAHYVSWLPAGFFAVGGLVYTPRAVAVAVVGVGFVTVLVLVVYPVCGVDLIWGPLPVVVCVAVMVLPLAGLVGPAGT